MLIGQFWGTSAAEGIPAPFCRCQNCLNARKKGGASIRTRSCFRLTEEIMLDLGADAVAQSVKYGELSAVQHILVTHTHEDHLNPHMLMEAMWSREYRKTLHYYLTDKAFDIVEHWRRSPWILKGMVPRWEEAGIVAFHRLEYGRRMEIAGIGATPFRGNHRGNVGEDSALYLLELPKGQTLFYGLDSGPYYPETIAALKGRTIDIFISEATLGARIGPNHPNHMNLQNVRDLTETLLAQGTLTPGSRLYLTHINHHSAPEELEACLEQLHFPIPTVVAWDGMKIF